MVDVVKEALDIAFNEPPGAGKASLNLHQRRMTASPRPETAGAILKIILIDAFQDHPDDLLHQLVIEALDPQWTELAILFRNVDSPGRFGLVAFVPQRVNQSVDPAQGHAVGRYFVNALGHVAGFGIDVLICGLIQAAVVQQAVDALISVGLVLTVLSQAAQYIFRTSHRVSHTLLPSVSRNQAGLLRHVPVINRPGLLRDLRCHAGFSEPLLIARGHSGLGNPRLVLQ